MARYSRHNRTRSAQFWLLNKLGTQRTVTVIFLIFKQSCILWFIVPWQREVSAWISSYVENGLAYITAYIILKLKDCNFKISIYIHIFVFYMLEILDSYHYLLSTLSRKNNCFVKYSQWKNVNNSFMYVRRLNKKIFKFTIFFIK